MIVASGQYAVVDPENPRDILYLTKKEYLKLSGIALSNDTQIAVLASPYDQKPKDDKIEAPKPENSPPVMGVGHAIFWRGMLSRIARSYRAFLARGSTMFDTQKIRKGLPGLVKRWSLAVGHWAALPSTTRGYFSDILVVSKYLSHVLSTQGTSGLVLRLKTSMLFVQSYLAGAKLKSDAFTYPVRLTNYLPAWLPLHARNGIRQRSKKVIRFWMSIFYIYKVIQMPYNLRKAVASIQTPKLIPDLVQTQMFESYRQFLRTIFIPKICGGIRAIPKFVPGQFFTPVSAGPNGAPAVNRVADDAGALYEQHVSVKNDESVKDGTPRVSIIRNIIYVAMHFCIPLEVYDITDVGKRHVEDGFGLVKKRVGKPRHHSVVHLLPEPAGKIRAIAIFDIFSQRVLKPLHDDIFLVLKSIKQDGTHSQTSLMSWLKNQAKSAWVGFTWSSLDISAATDSIPVQLYQILLEELYGHTAQAADMAKDVLALMTDREFTVKGVSQILSSDSKDVVPETVRYTRGQPMGCLGSFALLALWNHSWVQFASWLLSGNCLTSYGVTGDDVVIAEPSSSSPIGKKYVELSNIFMIPISLTKSFVSSALFNFLSRTWFEGEEISPASLKEDITIRDSSTRVQRAIRLLDRDWWNSDGNGWLAKAVRYFLYPSEYLVACANTRRGILNGYGLRAAISFLSPSASVKSSFGISNVPIMGWLSAFAGSTALLAHGDMLREDTLLPKKVTRESSTGIIQDFLNSILREIIDVYQWNDDASGVYLEWLDKQNPALREPGILGLFLVSEWDFHSYHLEDTRWLYPDITEGYTNTELVAKLGESWWHPTNAAVSVTKALEWLADRPRFRDFSDPDLFVHQAGIALRTRKMGEQEFSKFERKALSMLFLISQGSNTEIDLKINQAMSQYLERKYLDKFLGFTPGSVADP
jgi:hypothetical protein